MSRCEISDDIHHEGHEEELSTTRLSAGQQATTAGPGRPELQRGRRPVNRIAVLIRTHGGVVGQVWRDGRRQARLAATLSGLDVRPLNDALGRAAGELLARTRGRDVIDAALALLAADGDEIVTSDPDDLEPLARVLGRHVEIIRT
jgi:hypothetical protein